MTSHDSHSHRDRLAIQALINVPSDIFVLLDPQAVIVDANQVMARMVRVPVDELVGRVIWELFPPAQVQSRRAAVERVLQSKVPERLDDIGIYGRYDTVVYPILDQAGNVQQVAVLARDITERYQYQEELRQAREELEQRVIERTAALEASNHELRREAEKRLEAEKAWRRTAARNQVLARVAASANAQHNLEQMLQIICDETVQALPFSIASVGLLDESRDVFIPRANAAAEMETILRGTYMPLNYYEGLLEQFGAPIVILDTTRTPPFNTMTVLNDLSVRTLISFPLYQRRELFGYIIVASIGEIQPPTAETLEFLNTLVQHIELALENAHLIRELSQSQDRLRSLSNRLVEEQEAKRRELARELHDEVGQMLSSLTLTLELAAREVTSRLGADQAALAPLLAGHRQVEGLLQQVRNLSLDLRPSVLDDLGLLAALLDYFERFTQRNGVQVRFKQNGLGGRFAPEIEITAFRIIQEALNNAARHSGASEVEVVVWTTAQTLHVKIQDRGVGFDLLEAQQPARSNGLSGMSERAAAYGGRLQIESAPGQGATLELELPVQPADNPNYGGQP